MNFCLPELLAFCFKCLRPSSTISHALSVKYFFKCGTTGSSSSSRFHSLGKTSTSSSGKVVSLEITTPWPAPNDERCKCAFFVDVILLPQKTNEKPWFVACDLQQLYKIELRWPQTLWTQKSSKMAMWTCGLCVGFAALLLCQMLAHIRQVHSGDKEFEITCGISNFEKSYKKYDSFYRHVKNRHHAYLTAF